MWGEREGIFFVILPYIPFPFIPKIISSTRFPHIEYVLVGAGKMLIPLAGYFLERRKYGMDPQNDKIKCKIQLDLFFRSWEIWASSNVRRSLTVARPTGSVKSNRNLEQANKSVNKNLQLIFSNQRKG